MGLSLRNITKKVSDVLGAAKAQVNPFDNGQTYNTVRQNRPLPPAAPSVIHQVGNIGKQTLVQPAQTLYRTGIAGPVRLGAAELTHNTQALNNLRQSLNQYTPKKVVGAGVQLGTALAPIPGLKAGGPIAAKIAKGLSGGAAIGAGSSAGSQLAQGQKISLKPTLQGAAAGALLGGVAPTIRPIVKTYKEGNQVGAVGNLSPALPGKSPKTPVSVKPTTKPAGKGTFTADSYANTFGVSKAQAVKDVAKANLQTESPTIAGKGLPAIKRPSIPTTDNPIKVQLSNPKAGEYGAAVADKQRVESNIGQAAARAEYSVKRLSQKDKELFVHARENPSLISKAENPEKLQEAIRRYGVMTDTAHAFDIAAGGKTPHIGNYYRHVIDLSKPEDATRFQELAQSKGYTTDPFSYEGLNNQPRVFKSVKKAEGAGFKVTNKDPLQEIQDYANRAKGVVSNQALARGAQLADAARGPQAALTKKFEISPGRYVDISPEASKALRGTQQLELSKNPLIKGLRTANVGLKTSILSGGQFHPFNISVMRAGPALALKGHPLRAAKGIGGTFRPLLPGGSGAVDRMFVQAQKDGMIDKAAQIGMPYGQAGYNVAGSSLKHGVGHKLVFEKQMPMMHNQVVRSIISDLKKKNIPLDSAEARQAGVVGNSTMGFINKEALNMPPRVRQAMTDFMLAGQFTPSKFVTLSRAGKGGVAGNYARADVAANVLGATAVIAGVGYLVNQKSDNVRDMLLRALVNPAVPTPYQDKKGNTQELRIPLTYTSEIAHILGVKLNRQKDGHLGVSWEPTKQFSKNSPALEWARARLSPLAGTGVKVATNTNFSNKPLYDPQAAPGAKTIQAGTTLGQGFLPIGAQGLPFTGPVKNALPQSARDVLENNTPGSNPLLKSGLSSVGFSPRTDQTVGKGLQSSQYFASKDKFTKSLSPNDQALFNSINPIKKNPLTGQPTYDASIFNKSANYNLLADNPEFTSKYQTYQKSQSSHDPLWDLPKDKLQAVLLLRGGKTYPGQTYTKGGVSLSQAVGADQPWYKDFLNKEQDFYSSIPASSDSSTKLDYGPQASPYVSKQLNAKNYKDPQVLQYLRARDSYTNSQRQKQGLVPIADFGKTGQSGQLDNPIKIAITPKGSSTGSKKTKTSRSSSRAPTGRISLTKGKASAPKVSVKAGKVKSTLKSRSTPKLAKAKISLRKSLV